MTRKSLVALVLLALLATPPLAALELAERSRSLDEGVSLVGDLFGTLRGFAVALVDLLRPAGVMPDPWGLTDDASEAPGTPSAAEEGLILPGADGAQP